MAAILSAILVFESWTKPVFELELEVGRSNLCMKFGRNLIKNDCQLSRVTTDRRAENIRGPNKMRLPIVHKYMYSILVFLKIII